MKYGVIFLALAVSLTPVLAACKGETAETEHIHSAAQYSCDENQHWKLCAECGERFASGSHSLDAGNRCTVCAYRPSYTEGLRYTLDTAQDTYTVAGVGDAADETKLVLPAYYAGKPVAAIGDHAFSGCANFTGTVKIPQGVTSVGHAAFSDCSGITAIVIPASVNSIGDGVFSGCAALESIAVAEGSAAYGSEDGILYNAAKTQMLFVPQEIKGAVFVPEGIETVGQGWFSGRSKLTGVTLAGAKNVETGAFYGCSDLKYADLGRAETIGDSAFCGCTSLTDVTFSDGLTAIGAKAFSDCGALSGALSIPDSVVSVGAYAFSLCYGLTEVTVGRGVSELGKLAFFGCTSLVCVRFADPNGWYVSGPSDGQNIPLVGLEDETRAKELLLTYFDRDWYRQ